MHYSCWTVKRKQVDKKKTSATNFHGRQGKQVTVNDNLNDIYRGDDTVNAKRSRFNVLTNKEDQAPQDYLAKKAKFNALVAGQADDDTKSDRSETFVEEEELPEVEVPQNATFDKFIEELREFDSFTACTIECFARKSESEIRPTFIASGLY